MPKLYAIIVHGIGSPKPGYAEPLIEALKKRFNQKLQKALKSKDDFSGELEIREVLWDDVVAKRQAELANLLKKGFSAHKPKDFRAFISKIFSFVTRPFLRLRSNFAAEFVGDILGYSSKTGAYQKIQSRLLEAIDRFVPGIPKVPLSIISHSLGTVISSDFIYDRQKALGCVHEKFILSNFFTLGSPIALFALRYGPEMFNDPIHMEEQNGRWLNIFDLDDPIAYPLKNLNDAYDKAVAVDLEVNTGGFGVSHERYFGHAEVQSMIADKLAENWIRAKNK